ncbi:MAG: Cache 3/Cache 2 fusion domain-containing protein [Acidimicrobiales bacterium]
MAVFRNLEAKITLSAVVAVAATAIAVSGAVYAVSGEFVAKASGEADAQIEAQLQELTTGSAALVNTTEQALSQQLAVDIAAMTSYAAALGPFRPGETQLEWSVTSPGSDKVEAVTLPQLMVGDTSLGQQSDPDRPVPVVDWVSEVTGARATIFQRMNEGGDMLRVATTVPGSTGKRGIGTAIRVTNADGTPNQVLAAVLRGETYQGVATVLGTGYQTVYQPITGPGGGVIGMLFVGIPQDTVSLLTDSLEQKVVGDSGYVTVVQGSGVNRGRKLAGRDDGTQVGDDLLKAESTASWLGAAIDTATALDEGQVADIELPDVDGEPMLGMVAYDRSWDWVIITRAHRNEFDAVSDAVAAGRARMLALIGAASLGGAVLGGILVGLRVRRLTRPVVGAGENVRRVSSGDDGLTALSGHLARSAEASARAAEATAASANQVRDDLGGLSNTVDELTAAIEQISAATAEVSMVAASAVDAARTSTTSMDHVLQRSGEVGQVVDLITQIAEETKLLALNASIEAARAGAAGRGFAVVADEVKSLAQQTAESTGTVAEKVSAMTAETSAADEAITGVADVIQRIEDLQRSIDSAVQQQTDTTMAIARTIEQAAERARAISAQADVANRAAASSASDAGAVRQAAQRLAEAAETLEHAVSG